MNLRQILQRLRDSLLLQEDLNFLLTNRIPRTTLTRFMGWFSQIRHPWVARASIAVWRLFADLDLSDAKQQNFHSLHDCFTRELKPGARPVDMAADVLTSPCDAIVGACGPVAGTTVFQAKGFPYTLQDLAGGDTLVQHFQDGCYITLRLTSSMYHRFHAPANMRVQHVTYISGDTWNVNPVALKRVEKLFCKNERALVEGTLASGHPIALVPVAAVLVASMRLHWLNVRLHLRYRGPNHLPCDATFAKGQEMGWFEHGSTILLFVPNGFQLCEGIALGTRVRMGQRLVRVPETTTDRPV